MISTTCGRILSRTFCTTASTKAGSGEDGFAGAAGADREFLVAADSCGGCVAEAIAAGSAAEFGATGGAAGDAVSGAVERCVTRSMADPVATVSSAGKD